jgi:hypothetical protein
VQHPCRYIIRPAVANDKPDTGTYHCQLLRMEQCPHYGGTSKIIATLEHPTVMAKLLTHLGLPIRAPPRATFAVIRPTPNGLIPTDPRFTPVQPLSRHSPLTFTRARRQNAQKLGTEGRSMARKVPDSRLRLACLTTRLTQRYSSLLAKRAFKIPIPQRDYR